MSPSPIRAVSGLARSRTLVLTLVAALLVVVALPAAASAVQTRFLSSTFDGSGSDAGAFSGLARIAVHEASGTVYAIDAGGSVVDKFDASGTAQDFSALSSSSLDGSAVTAPDGPVAFLLGEDSDLAVDNSGTASDGNVVVLGENQRTAWIFDATGAYLHRITGFGDSCGAAVDATGNVWIADYVTNSIIQHDASGTPTGTSIDVSGQGSPCHFDFAPSGDLYVALYNGALLRYDSSGAYLGQIDADATRAVAVDPTSGHVFAVHSGRVAEYDASGALVTEFGQAELSSAIGVAVGLAGEVYVSSQGDQKVHVYGGLVSIPSVTTGSASAVAKATATLNGTVNPDGENVTDCHFEYTDDADFQANGYANATEAPCIPDPGSGSADVDVAADVAGLTAETTYHFRLVAANSNGTNTGSDQVFQTAAAVKDLVTGQATDVERTTATLNGSLDPDGAPVSDCHFEYTDETDFQANDYAGATQVACAPAPGSGSGSVDVAAAITGLTPGNVTYRFRLVATNASGSTRGSDQVFATRGATITNQAATAVDVDSATLSAQINPNGQATTYHFEYGTDTNYGHTTPESASVGSDSSDHPASATLTGLAPGTTYHWRAVATNAAGAVDGAERTFTTHRIPVSNSNCPNQQFRTGPGAVLPNCRAYEMVSPPDKNDGDVSTLPNFNGRSTALRQSSVDGNGFTYSSYRSFGNPQGAPYTNQYLARRSSQHGWQSEAINPPRNSSTFLTNPLENAYKAFSPDLSQGWLLHDTGPALTSCAPSTYSNLYRRDEAGSAYESLGCSQPTTEAHQLFAPELEGFSADGSKAVFRADDKLTADASTAVAQDNSGFRPVYQVYESVGDDLHLVSVLPDGTVAEQDSSAGTGLAFTNSVFDHNRYQLVDNAVSADGTRVFWSAWREFGEPAGSSSLYLRMNTLSEQSSSGQCDEVGKACTIPVSGSVSDDGAFFQGADPDATRALFSFGDGPLQGNLYEFDVDDRETHLIATGVVGHILGSSDDLSRIYYVSKNASAQAQADGAVEGKPNIYLHDAGATRFIGTLSDAPSSQGNPQTDMANQYGWPTAMAPISRVARVSPDGLHLVFMSNSRNLSELAAGYDSTDAVSGQADSEIYRYAANGDGGAGKLLCVSCNPTGTRPHGREIAGGLNNNPGPWAAATVPVFETQLYQPRYLSDTGDRVFFNSFDPLVPRDANGKEDVYQWEAPGSGDCSAQSAAYAVSAEGCISLISSGRSADNSRFLDANSTGSDVFFTTSEGISAQDAGQIDVYDARIDGGIAQVVSPPGCQGEACQGSSQRPSDSAPASSLFTGAGNVGESRSPRVRIVAKAARGAVLRLRVRVSGKGVITASGAGLTRARKSVRRAGTYTISLSLSARARQTLARRHTLKVAARVRFAPTSGAASRSKVTATFKQAETKAPKTRAATKNSGGVK